MTWTITQPAFDDRTAKAWEGLFTLGSSGVHLRGSYEQPIPGAVQDHAYDRRATNVTAERFPERVSKWGTYIPGVYGPHPTLNSELINLPWPLDFRVRVGEHELVPGGPDVARDVRTLDLQHAILWRVVQWQVPAGPTLEMTFSRRVSRTRPGVIIQRLALQSDRPCAVVIEAGIDARVRTNGHDHFQELIWSESDREIGLIVHTDGGDAIHYACRLGGDVADLAGEFAERYGGWVGHVRLDAGQQKLVTKITTLAANTSAALPASDETSQIEAADDHAWVELWQTCRIEIEGDDEAQQAADVALFHLLRAHPCTGALAIDAKGYAGEAYWGRFFWDTEMYLLPFFAYTQPERARELAMFRIATLDGARANAAELGYRGARFAWESDHRGIECCPNWQYSDHEVHVTADVVFGFEHYARASGEADFLSHEARETILETARYWLGRVSRRAGDDRAHLLGVMGPDEYTPITSNNAFTNRLVARALALASALADEPAEQAEFRSVAESLPIARDGDLILQCEEWRLLGEPDFERTWTDRGRPYAGQVGQERLYRSKVLKQADVLMLMALLPHEFSDAQVQAAWDEYLPYTTHDSSLSPGAHALVALRLGRTQDAWDFWRRGSGLDLDIGHGGAAEGVHIAAAGATWQMIVLGFAGLHTAMQTDVLTLDPKLPNTWTSLTFPLCWRGSRVRVELAPACAQLTHLSGPALEVIVRGQQRTLDEHSSRTWELT